MYVIFGVIQVLLVVPSDVSERVRTVTAGDAKL